MERIIKQRPMDGGRWTEVDDQTLTDSGFYWRERDGVRVLVCEPLERAGFANGFSTRLGGVSNIAWHISDDVASDSSLMPPPSSLACGALNLAGFDEDSAANIHENRRRFLAVFDFEYRLATAWQMHGDRVVAIRTEDDIADSKEKADGLVSDMKNLLVGVKTADCVPILIGDPVTKAFAAVHAGWRGTVESIVAKAVDVLAELYGSDPAELVCAIGPAAGCENYEIGQDVIDAFAEKFSTSGKYFRESRPGHAFIDLHLANKDQLTARGVYTENIFTAPFCTISRTDLFFSYRIEKKKYGKTGRLLSVIGRIQTET